MRIMTQDTLHDYHFLLVAPNLGAEWFYDAARAYWLTFFPTVVSDYNLVRLVPENFTVAVTVITRRDLVSQLGVTLAQAVPRALFDPVVHDFYEDTRAELNRRAETNQPFGVPLRPTPTPTIPATAQPVEPTAGPIFTAPPSPTPSPTEQGFLRPTATPDEATEESTEEAPTGPLFPTPGPVTGGSS